MLDPKIDPELSQTWDCSLTRSPRLIMQVSVEHWELINWFRQDGWCQLNTKHTHTDTHTKKHRASLDSGFLSQTKCQMSEASLKAPPSHRQLYQLWVISLKNSRKNKRTENESLATTLNSRLKLSPRVSVVCLARTRHHWPVVTGAAGLSVTE